MCFTETHLDDTVLVSDILLSQTFDIFRKDRNCHGGGILVYLNERVAELEVFRTNVFGLKLNKRVSCTYLEYSIVLKLLF